MKNRVKILIASRSYTIIGEDTEEHIDKVGKLVDSRVREMASAYPELSIADRAVLAAVNVADEHIKTREKLMRMVETLNRSEQELTHALEASKQEIEDLKQRLEETENLMSELEAAAEKEADDPEPPEVVFDMGRHQEARESGEMMGIFDSTESEDSGHEEEQSVPADEDVESESSGVEPDLDDWDDIKYLRKETETEEAESEIIPEEEKGLGAEALDEDDDWREAEDTETIEEAKETETDEGDEDDESGRFAEEAEFESPELAETDEMMPMDSDGWQPADPGIHQTSFNLGDDSEADEEELYPDTSLLDDDRYDGYNKD